MIDRCGNCRYWDSTILIAIHPRPAKPPFFKKDEGSGEFGDCKINPPMPTMDAGGESGGFPRQHHQDWCAKFDRREQGFKRP